MIWESHYWKDDLLRHARFLRKKRKPGDWSDLDVVKLEKAILLGFYTIRKLIEAEKIATRFKTHEIDVVSYPPSGRAVTRMNWHKIDILYDFDSPRSERRLLPFLADQAIHSFVFQHAVGEDGEFEGILLASDRQRKKSLLQISADSIIDVFTDIGKNYPATGRYILNPATGDYDVHSE
tara:strand:+ start:271 stop:807 length:537 start_codon:yes stop_codon:yes gene_type:complete